MSLIFDAIRRAESEREPAQTAPGGQALAGHPAPVSSANRPLILTLLVIISVLLALLLVLLARPLAGYLASTPHSQSPVQAPLAIGQTQVAGQSHAKPVEQMPEQPAQLSAAQPIAPPQAAPYNGATQSEAVTIAANDSEAIDSETIDSKAMDSEAIVKDAAPGAVVMAEKKAGVASAAQSPPAPAARPPNDSVALLYRQKQSPQLLAPASEISEIADAAELDENSRKTSAPQTVSKTLAAPASANQPKLPPLISELSASAQRAIPTIEFTTHVFAEKAGASFVMLNGAFRRPGDEVLPGLVLESVDKNYIVLNYHGQVFRLDSLNSWINY